MLIKQNQKKQNKKIPKLRFPEFGGEWEEKRLGEVATFWNGKAHEQNISENGEYIVVNSKFISSDGEVKKYSNSQISPLKKGDIAMVMSDVPNGKAIAKCFLIDADDRYTLNQRIGGIRSDIVISSFLFRILNRNKYFLRFDNGVSQTNLRKEEILRCPVIFPSLREQQKIADFLSVVDKRIGVLQKKREALEKYKKGIMQHMLSGHIRFAEFKQTELKVREGYIVSKLGSFPIDWELKQLKDVVWFQEGPGVMTSQFTKTGVKLFNGTNIQKNKIILDNTSTFISEKEAYGKYKHFLADVGDLVIACSGISVEKFDEKVAFVSSEHLPLCMNTSTMRFKSLNNNVLDIKYFSYFIRTSTFKDQVRRQITGSAQLNFGPTHVGTFYIPLPSIKEQQKIANFLSVIDKKIELVDAQIQKMQEWKRGLMQGLFV